MSQMWKYTQNRQGKGGRIMKYDGFIYIIDWDCVSLIPTIILSINEPMKIYKNISIIFSWLGWHLKWKWGHK